MAYVCRMWCIGVGSFQRDSGTLGPKARCRKVASPRVMQEFRALYVREWVREYAI